MILLKTIGYEGATLPEFIATLEWRGVTLVTDVRAIAVSRRKGFSKSALSAALAERSIRYVHLRELGDPKAGREAARAGYMQTFRDIYSTQLASQRAQDELAALVEITKSETACLLCYEADARDCHRSLIVEALRGFLEVEVEHLQVSRDGAGIHRAGRNLGEGRAAA
jgi:uncharacterized protein (DUF488 family)